VSALATQLLLAADSGSVDAAEEGSKIITAMLLVGLVFLSLVVFGDAFKAIRHRRNRR
jgi:hypothetical protein